ncbi:MAG TPA: hypothetical protein ENI74_09165 [Gammaproteobacteria bacterium]|nr:hypothetical protein [Gammaproteobacteria bacterium]
MKISGYLLLLIFPLTIQAETRQWVLSADEWARPRDGQSVARMAPLPEIISSWSSRKGQRLLIRYPGGEEGLLWAYELRSWLVALGVPMEDQELVVGSHQADRIELELTRQTE